MKHVTPNVFIIGETRINPAGFDAMLEEIGVPQWESDSDNDAQVIVETAGKLCYMSFDVSLNKNLTKTGGRTNSQYIRKGIIAQMHGSVLEHVAVTLTFTNVSRVFTHELVRHRPGAAYSQTSGRYVRLDELPFWIPSCIRDNPALEYAFVEAIESQERSLAKLVELSGIATADFARKKELTSAFRRIIGNGIANNITATYNHRALRHLVESRTSRHAEEEIRLGFNKVFEQLVDRYPDIYADAKTSKVNGYFEILFDYRKV